jgi:hypothetical protein
VRISVIDLSVVSEVLRLNEDGRLHHREGQELEFKEQFSLAALADYFRDFAAFANNRGGHLIFGVKDKPRTLIGMSAKSIEQFERIDPQIISGHLLQTFSCEISWQQCVFESDGRKFGVFRVEACRYKPVIATKDEGKDGLIKSGEIYYRYGGRTQRIQGAELQALINHRLEQNNQQWLDLLQKIGNAGPQNAAILDTEAGIIAKNGAQILVLDKGLASKLKFVREGQFVEKEGAPTLKLIGDVTPVEQVEVIQHVKEHLTKSYPLSANELAAAVKEKLPGIGRNEVWRCLSENNIKGNADYSAYNFRNKAQEDAFRASGVLPTTTPVIYNRAAVDYIVRVLTNNLADA